MLFLYKRYTNVSNCLFSMLFTRCRLVLKVMYNSFNTSVAIMLFMLVAIMRIVKYKSTVIDAIKSPITSSYRCYCTSTLLYDPSNVPKHIV